MASLLNLADELLHEVFTYVYPSDLASLARTCKTSNAHLGNKILWKDAYYLHMDDPPKPEGMDWEQELKDIVRMQRILESTDTELKRDNIALVARTAIKLIERANKSSSASLNLPIVKELFQRPDNRNVFLFSSSLYGTSASGDKRAGTGDQIAANTYEERQLSAQLHVYFGTSLEVNSRTRSGAAHPYARSRVYDLRHYNDRNCWGPYLDDRSFKPDWEKIEAIMVDLGFNMQRFIDGIESSEEDGVDMYGKPFEGITPGSYVPIKQFVCPGVAAMVASGQWKARQRAMRCPMGQPDIPLDARDPYGISGTWRRIVCFLDYNDLYAFNFIGSDPAGDEWREPITTTEAIRLITMKIKVSAIEEPGEEDGKELPVVHFTGMSRSMHATWDPNANSKLTGTVRLTPNGDVRWTTLSIFHGEARWRSESIQLGGIKSARGVIGTWFDKDYDPNGPAGPTAFWKVCDQDQGHVWEDEPDSD